MATLYAGASGFAYPAWKPDFYPEKLPAKKFLNHYASVLNAVEINYTFRRLPSATTLQGWVEQTPDHFKFALKAHQRLTHIQRLQVTEFNEVFFRAIDPLRVKGRLGPLLFQLAPNLKLDVALLKGFLDSVPDGLPLTFEFRNRSWFTDEVFQMLEARNFALCLAESEKLVAPERITAGFVYFRLRKESYAPEEIAEIRAKCQTLLAQGKDVYVFFKHEETPDGAFCARDLLRQS
jgi:uncharacterized protein YecE (DUF72 family)